MTETRWLTEEERAAWVRLAAVVELLPRALDAQLQRDAALTHFEYFTLAMLSEAPERTVRMSTLAAMTNATPPRLSKVMSRLESEGYVERRPCPGDGRATNAVLTDRGWAKVVEAAPGHVETVRTLVVDPLTSRQVRELAAIADRLLERLDPEGKVMRHPS